MHIAFNGWFWNQPNTGSGQYVRYLLPALRRAAPDLAMTLVLPPNLDAADDLPPNVNVVPTSGSKGNVGKVWFEQRTYPQMVARVKADIAHVPYWGSPLSSPARLITSVLDVIPLVIPQYASGLKAQLYVSLVSAAARGSAHIITISEASKADIVTHLDIPEEMITVTHLAADEGYHPRMGAERDAEVKAKYNLPDNFVLYIGGFDLRKRLNQLLLAWTYVAQAEGDNVTLVLAGREPEWGTAMFPDMRRYAKELDIEDNVQWIGYVEEADKPSLFRLARAFATPTMYEGFGLPVLEAMASGTPVIANETSSIPEIAGDGAYLVPPGDSRRMAGAILGVLLQDQLRDTLVAAGLSRATHFQWRKTAKETLAVYDRVMAMKE